MWEKQRLYLRAAAAKVARVRIPEKGPARSRGISGVRACQIWRGALHFCFPSLGLSPARVTSDACSLFIQKKQKKKKPSLKTVESSWRSFHNGSKNH